MGVSRAKATPALPFTGNFSLYRPKIRQGGGKIMNKIREGGENKEYPLYHFYRMANFESLEEREMASGDDALASGDGRLAQGHQKG